MRAAGAVVDAAAADAQHSRRRSCRSAQGLCSRCKLQCRCQSSQRNTVLPFLHHGSILNNATMLCHCSPVMMS